MKIILPIGIFCLFLTACQSDESKRKDFAGTYEVTLETPTAQKEMEQAKEKMQEDIEKAKEDIRNDIEKTKEDIEKELGRESNLGEALGQFAEGMGKFAEGMASLGEHLGKMGINLGSGILNNLRFRAEFKDNGDVVFGKFSNISVGNSDQVRWDIRDGRFHLWNEAENKDPQVFDMKKISDSEWDLVGEKVIFHLKKQ